MARLLSNVSCRLFLRNNVNHLRRISSSNIEQIEEALRNRKEFLFTPCSTGLSRSEKDHLATCSIPFDELYVDGIEELNYLCKTGSSRQTVTVAALLRFMEQKGDHENSLLSLRKDFSRKAERMTESDISAILAVHLVSQLVVESSTPCMVSNDSKWRTPWCPCGTCQSEVTYGNTGFGSEELWYGKPDIVAFPLGAGSVSVIVKKNIMGTFRDISKVKEDSEESVVEVKGNTNNLQERISNIPLQAITFSFLQNVFQKNKNIPETEVVSLIPTVALFSEGADVYMYDTKYDICLKSDCDALPFWNEATDYPTLNLNTIISLWMMFNHLTFRPRFSEKMINHLKGSCGFQKGISPEKLEKIEKSMKMQKYYNYMKNIRNHKVLNQAF